MTRSLKSMIAAAAFGCAVTIGAQAGAGTLENMERERAILLGTLLSSELSAEQKQRKTELIRNRLIDLERMVLRDKSLVGKTTPRVRAAFDNYDLTFLVHASVENNRSLIDHWLQQVGVSTTSLMNARIGTR